MELEEFKCNSCSSKFSTINGITLHVLKNHFQDQSEDVKTKHESSEEVSNFEEEQNIIKTPISENEIESLCKDLKNHDKNYSEICRFCEANLLSSETRNRHEKMYCHKNPKSFFHMKIACNENGQFKCPKCPKTFQSIRPGLFHHYERIHTVLPARCHQCHNVYKNRETLYNHIRRGHCSMDLHTAVTCQFCSKEFGTKAKGSVMRHYHRDCLKNTHSVRSRMLKVIETNQEKSGQKSGSMS